MSKKTKALVLLSGGLDSRLAARVMQENNIDVIALNFVSPFCTCTKKGCRHEASRVAEKHGFPIKIITKGDDYLEIVKNPKHGYGSGMNPCLDCRVFTLRKAKEYMKETGASFIVTGEVVGQRPMSQRMDAIRKIEREADVEGLVLRPLSAKLFPPIIPEETGLIDREKMLSISGRSRKPQMELAEKLNVKDFACPAGGCLLTDKGFALRLRDLLERNPQAGLNDVKLLKQGRHFWSGDAKIIVGRNEAENHKLTALANNQDVIFEAADYPGPVTLVRGPVDKKVIEEAAMLTAFYGQAPKDAIATVNHGPKSDSGKYSTRARAERPNAVMVSSD